MDGHSEQKRISKLMWGQFCDRVSGNVRLDSADPDAAGGIQVSAAQPMDDGVWDGFDFVR